MSKIGILSISGERKPENEKKGVKFHRVERAYGRFERSFTLPDEADRTRSALQDKEVGTDDPPLEEPEGQNQSAPNHGAIMPGCG